MASPLSMQYRYIERCSMGYVEFKRNDQAVRFHTGEAVETPDWLAGKLANNSAFELVIDEDTALVAAAPRRGRPPKVISDASGA